LDLDSNLIDGVIITDKKIYQDDKGSILHMLRSDSDNFKEFGEIYFSEVNYNVIKGWKKHNLISQNFVVPHGKLKLVIYDGRPGSSTSNQFMEIIIGRDNYKMVTIPTQVWYSFKGLSKSPALIANLISSPHDPSESQSLEIHSKEIPYIWKHK